MGHSYPCTGDVAELGELGTQSLVVEVVIKVLNVEVDALIAVDALHLEAVELVLQLGLSLVLLLRATHVHRL